MVLSLTSDCKAIERRSFLPGDLIGAVFATDALLDATSDVAILEAMLAFEAALVRACQDVGLVPDAFADEIVTACDVASFDVHALARDARGGGNPAIPLVKTLRSKLSPGAMRWVHLGATSQDVIDTAMVVIAKRVAALIRSDALELCNDLLDLADVHRTTPMLARTLMQPAIPTTFGLKCANWAVGLADSLAEFDSAAAGLSLQFGGPAGSLSGLGDHGVEVSARLAQILEVPESPLPWHTNRQRIVRFSSSLVSLAGSAAKIAGDIILLSQSEVSELAERPMGGGGGSSSIPQKANPILSVTATACYRTAVGANLTISAAMMQEHERAAGSWHSEWLALISLMTSAGTAVNMVRNAVGSLEIDEAAMIRNLDSTAGRSSSEALMALLVESMDYETAASTLTRLLEIVNEEKTSLEVVTLRELVGSANISRERIQLVFDPLLNLGSTQKFIDRALAIRSSWEGSR